MLVHHAITRIAGSKWLRWLGAACVSAIAVLSLVPKDWKAVDSAVVHGTVQHFVAYLVAAVAIGLGARRRLNPVITVGVLAAYAGMLEILQIWSPGRDPGLAGFLSSSLGAAVGTVVISGLRRT